MSIARTHHGISGQGIQCSKLLVHTPKFGIKPHGIGSSIDLAISKKRQPEKYPYNSDQIYAGVLVKYFDPGQPSNVLGDAYGLVLFYDFKHRLSPLTTGWFWLEVGYLQSAHLSFSK